MAFSFKKLFSLVTGWQDPGDQSRRERVRQQAESEHAAKHAKHIKEAQAESAAPKARKTAADELQAGLKSLKAKIAAGGEQIRTDTRKKLAEELEGDRLDAMGGEERFIRGLYKLTYGRDFGSTNPDAPAVYQVWYMPQQQEIFITFHDNTSGIPRPGPTYKYWTIDVHEAAQMYRASSKGIAVWDQYRVRGSKIAHRKNYALVSG